MSYFDSPKNRALWEKELATLRKIKEARANGSEYDKNDAGKTDVSIERNRGIENARSNENVRSAVVDSNRIRTSYKQLLLEEAASVRKKKQHEASNILSKDHNLDIKMSI